MSLCHVAPHRSLTPLLLVAALAASARADVAISLHPEAPVVGVGQTVGVGVQLSAPTPALVAAAQVIFGWDPAELRLLGISNDGAANLLTSALLRPDPYGINEAALPADGDAIYIAFARLGAPLTVSEEGESVLLTTLLFEALTPTLDADITVLTSAGTPPGHTSVFDGRTANTNITGSLLGTSLAVVPAPAACLTLLGAGAIATTRRRRHDD